MSAAIFGLLTPNRFSEQATRQSLQPEHLELSANSRIGTPFEYSATYSIYQFGQISIEPHVIIRFDKRPENFLRSKIPEGVLKESFKSELFKHLGIISD
jgi:hypothetical protein